MFGAMTMTFAERRPLTDAERAHPTEQFEVPRWDLSAPVLPSSWARPALPMPEPWRPVPTRHARRGRLLGWFW